MLVWLNRLLRTIFHYLGDNRSSLYQVRNLRLSLTFVSSMLFQFNDVLRALRLLTDRVLIWLFNFVFLFLDILEMSLSGVLLTFKATDLILLEDVDYVSCSLRLLAPIDDARWPHRVDRGRSEALLSFAFAFSSGKDIVAVCWHDRVVTLVNLKSEKLKLVRAELASHAADAIFGWRLHGCSHVFFSSFQ